MDVWKETASRSGSSLRHRGTSSRVSAGWTTLCLLLLPLAPQFCSECISESRLFSGALSSSTLGWLGCPPALAMGWTQMVEWVSAELDWSKAAFSLVLPKQASRAEHGKECILPDENVRLLVSLAFHTDMTCSNTWPGSKETRKSSSGLPSSHRFHAWRGDGRPILTKAVSPSIPARKHSSWGISRCSFLSCCQ